MILVIENAICKVCCYNRVTLRQIRVAQTQGGFQYFATVEAG